MALYTVLIFVLLAALGALIAWLGDLTGAWLGRRRSTILGMRPRRSARLIAALIGAVLPLIGLGVAILGSQYARIAVFQLRSIIQQRQQLTAEVEELTAQVSEYQQQAQTAEEHAASAEAKAATALAAQEDAQERIAALTARRDELVGRVEDLSARREELRAQLGAAQSDLAEAEADLRAAQADLTTTAADLEAKRREVEEKRLRVEQLGLEVEATNRDLAAAQGDLTGAREELAGAKQQLAERLAELQETETRLQQVERREVVLATRESIYEPGDELLRVVLPARETQDQMEADLTELLHLASAAAERKGLPEGENGRAVVLVSPWPPWATAGTTEVPEAMIVRYVASELRSRGPDEWVVMVRAFRRMVAEDRRQLPVELKAAPNRLVFHAGDVIDEFTISSRATMLQAFERIWLRITGKNGPVRLHAIAEGMLPHPETGNYGSVELADIFTAAEQVQAGEGLMQVRVVAAEDAYTRGPLLLDIKVAPEGSE